MCYRFFLKAQDLQKAAKKLRARTIADFQTRHNIAPGAPVPVLCVGGSHTRETQLMRWGLVPSWSKGPKDVGIKMANARRETLAEKASFKKALQQRRCLLPASGFFEWETGPGGEKLPWLFERSDAEPLLLAGLWEEWRGEEGQTLRSCAVVTTRPNSLLERIHDRMPVILDGDGSELWLYEGVLGQETLNTLTNPLPSSSLLERPVDTWVNTVGHEGERCLAPRAATPPPEQQLGLGL